MLLSMTDIQKKRGRPPTGITPIAAVRLPTDIRAALDRAIASLPEPRPSRSEFIRRLLTDHLREHGHLLTESEPQ